MEITALLDIHPKEKKKVFLCLLHAIAVGVIQCLVLVIPLSLFLEVYDINVLPYIYIGTALALLFLGFFYSILQKKASFYSLFSLLILAMLIPLLILNILVVSKTSATLISVFLLLIWAQLISGISDLEFWGLMNHLFNLSQAKRLFGLIGATASLTTIVTGLAIPLLVQFFSAQTLLLVCSFTLCSCLVILWMMKRSFPEQMLASSDEGEEEKDSVSKMSFLSSIRSPYISQIFIICFLTEITYFLVDMTFNASSQEHLVTQERMTSFFGLFYAFSSMLEILGRLVLFPLIIRKFGVINAGLLLPLLTVGVAVSGLFSRILSIPWMPALFFWLMVSNKLCQEVLRYAILEPTKLLMYQLFVPVMRIWILSKTETIIYPIATFLTAIMILFTGMFIEQQMPILLCLTAALSILTLYFVCSIKKHYISTLSEAIGKRYFFSDTTLPLDKTSQIFLEERTHSKHPGEVIYSLETLEKLNHEAFIRILPDALKHPSSLVKEFIIRTIQKYALKQFYLDLLELTQDSGQKNSTRAAAIVTLAALGNESHEVIKKYLNSSDPEIQGAAIIGLLEFGDQTKQAIANQALDLLVSSSEAEDRVQAALVLGDVHIFKDASTLMQKLLHDPDMAVQKASLMAISKAKFDEFYPYLISCLENHTLKSAANHATIQLGDDILITIFSAFPSYSHELRTQILRLIGQIEFTQENKSKLINWLIAQLYQFSPTLDICIWSALFKLGYRVKNDKSEGSKQLNEELERKNDELCYLVELIHSIPTDERLEGLQALLLGQMVNSEQEIYKLLSFRYPEHLIKQISQGINSTEEKKGYAIELIQQILKREHGSKILALIIEMHLNSDIRNNIKDNSPETLAEILKSIALNQKGYLTTAAQAAALYLLVKLTLPTNLEFFKESQFQANILLKETSEWAQANAILS